MKNGRSSMIVDGSHETDESADTEVESPAKRRKVGHNNAEDDAEEHTDTESTGTDEDTEDEEDDDNDAA